MNNKIIKAIISVCVIILLIIIIILSMLLQKKKQEMNNINTINLGEPGDEGTYDSQLHDVTNKTQYYTVRNCVNSYIKALYDNNSNYYFGDEKDEEVQKEYVYSLISPEYAKENNITEENVLTKITIYSKDKVFVPIKMKVLEQDTVDKYIAYGVVTNVGDYQEAQEIYVIVNMDNQNKTFSIEPINRQINNIDEINIQNKNVSIKENDYNSYQEPNVTNEYVTNEYFTLYKRLALSAPELVYNMFSNKYRDTRFGSLNSFKDYVGKNSEEIKKINMEQYLVDNYNDYNEYVAKDQFGNYYVFDVEDSKCDIDIKLDTYTIPTDKFKETYDKAEDEKKVQMNIDKFIQMINRHDYKTSYNCIADGFKTNYFDTQDKFENYIKNAFFEYNNFEFENIEQKGSNLYTCTVTLTDSTGNSKDSKKITIIMQLNDNYDFKMSFGV